MKLPLSWLKRYVDPKLSAGALADKLTLTGTKVERVETMHGEPVITLEITTNRPDCLSILGLAREVSATNGKPVSVPKAYAAKEAKISGKPVSVRIEDKKACPYYTARLIEDVKISPTPAADAKLLELMGTRPISNVVDATNFVLFEAGQPLHAFDADKLKGGIVVRRAKTGESIVGIDGNEYKLDADTLVIADEARPVAIAGVIGGKATEVTGSTKRVLLESAWFDPALVRKAARKYKISTESSYRFERRTNIEAVAAASRRATQLILEWAGGRTASGLIEAGKAPKVSGKVVLDLVRLEKILGMPVAAKRALAIFKLLGLSASASGKKISVSKTAGREDLQIEADLIEEVLRIEGFDKIPTTLPVTRHAQSQKIDPRPARVRALKHRLASAGFREILTYSLVSARMLEDSGIRVEEAPHVANFVSAEQEYLRPYLLPGFLSAVAFNANRKASSLKLFEIGKRYFKEAQGPADRFEETSLSLAFYGPFEENWTRKSESSLFDAKGAILDALAFLGARDVEFIPIGQHHSSFAAAAAVRENGRVIGIVGSVSEPVRKKWDIPHPVLYAAVLIEPLLERETPAPRLAAIPKYPSVRRDLAFVLDRGIAADRLSAAIRQAGAPHLQDVRLFDEYAGKNIPSGKRSLAFALSYQKETGTFTDAEIQAVQGRIVEVLKKDFGVEFR